MACYACVMQVRGAVVRPIMATSPRALERGEVASPWIEDCCTISSTPTPTVTHETPAAQTDGATTNAWRMAAAVGLSVALSAGGVASPAALSVAATPLPQDISALADSFGVETAVIESLEPRTLKRLSSIPADMRDMYRSLDAASKKEITENLRLKSRFLFITISHRSAFVRGNVLGMNVFDKMEKMLADYRARGEVDDKQAARFRQAIAAFRKMTSQQRSALADLLSADPASLESAAPR